MIYGWGELGTAMSFSLASNEMLETWDKDIENWLKDDKAVKKAYIKYVLRTQMMKKLLDDKAILSQ